MSGSEKVAAVTGAARGIGLATVRRLLEEGWRVAMLDVLADELRAMAEGLGAPGHVLAVPCDVSSPEEVSAAFQEVEARFGRLDALVNNAGIAIFKSIQETTFEDWSRVLAVNLSGPFLCTQAAVPPMSRQGARW